MAKEQLNKVNEQLGELTGRLNEAKAKADLVRNKIAVEQDKLFFDLCNRLNIPNIRYYEERQLKAINAMNETNMKFQSAISKLENQLIFETCRLEEAKQRVDQLLASQDSEGKALIATENAKRAIQTQCQTLQRDIRELTEQLTKAQDKSKTASNLVLVCQRARDHTRQALDAKIKSVLAKEALLSKLNGDRMLILRRCKLEEIPIPLDMGSLDNFDDESYAEASTFSRMTSSNWTVQLNFKSLSRELRSVI